METSGVKLLVIIKLTSQPDIFIQLLLKSSCAYKTLDAP